MIRQFSCSVHIANSKDQVLLLWHHKLHRWLPPGGHIEPNELPEEAAIRECKEETGLDVEIIGDWPIDVYKGDTSHGKMLKQPLHMDAHRIPARPEKNEPEHIHMNFHFKALLLDESQKIVPEEDKAQDIRWFTTEEILAMDPETEVYANLQQAIAQTNS